MSPVPESLDILAGIDKRLALLEQAHRLDGAVAKARSNATDRAIESLGIKVDAAIALWQNVTAEPSASPAGRALLNDVNNIERDLDHVKVSVARHNDFIQQANGAMKLARFAIGSSLLAVLMSVIQVISHFAAP